MSIRTTAFPASRVHRAAGASFLLSAALAPACPAQPTPSAPAPAPGTSAPGPPGDRVRVEIADAILTADEVEFRPENGLYVATGNPVATRGEDEIRGERMNINPRTRQFTAEGSVTIKQAGQEFRAAKATYNFDTREGLADEVQAVIGSYFVDAEEFEIRKGPVYGGRRVRFSTCPPDHNHYSAYTRLMELRPGERLSGKHVGLDVLGKRIITLPKLARSLRKEDADRQLYPSVGYSSRTGPYIAREFGIIRTEDRILESRVQLNTLSEPYGGLLFTTTDDLQVVGSLYYRDESENQFVRNLQVSRLPEIGLVYRPKRKANPGGLLSHQVYGVSIPRSLGDSRTWLPAAEVSAGYFRQHRGDEIRGPATESQFGSRLRVQLQAGLPLVDLGPIHLNDLRLMLRQTFYDNGDDLGVAGVGIGKRVRAGKFTLSLHRFDQWTEGASPFLFDHVELRQEWRPKIEYRSGGLDVAYILRLRGSEAQVFDHIISISKLTHCIQPRFTYRARRSSFLFEISIPGFSSYDRVEAGTPAARSREDRDPGP